MQTGSTLVKTNTNFQASQPPKEDQDEKRYRSFGILTLITANLCLGFFFHGYVFFYMGTFHFEVVLLIFNIDLDQNLALGILTGCIPIGASVGSLLGRVVIVKFSRLIRNSILLVNIVSLSMVCLTLIPNFPLLVISRLIQGICVGLYTSTVPVIVKQIVPREISGTFGAFSQLFIGVGAIAAIIIQKIITDTTGDQSLYWRIVFGFPIVTIITQSVMLLFVYNFETPKYLLQNDRQSDCKELINYIYKDQYVEKVLYEKKLDLGLIKVKQSNPEKRREIELIKHISNESQRNQEDHKEHPQQPLHRKAHRYFIATWVKIGQQLCGIQVIGVYGVFIIGQIIPDLEHLIPIFFRVIAIILGMASSVLLYKVGRRRMIQVCTLMALTSQLITCVGFIIKDQNPDGGNFMILFGLFFLALGYYTAIGPLGYLYISEVVSAEFVPIPTFINWVLAATISVLLPFLMRNLQNPYPIFLFFALWCFTSFVVNCIFMLETNGKTEKQIYDHFDENQFCPCWEYKSENSAKGEPSQKKTHTPPQN